MAVSLAAPTETGRIFAELHHERETLAAMDGRIIATQVALSEIPAPTHDERRRGREVAARMHALGLAVTIDDAVGNVVGRRAGASDEPPVVVCAHLDTVFDADTDVRVRRDGPRLVGPGIGDNARGLAAMLALAEIVDGASLRTMRPVDFVASVGEEALGDLRGAKHHFANGGRDAAAAIILDGPGDERVVHRAVGSRRVRIRFTGPGGHSWSAYGLPNPLNAAATVAARVARIAIPATPRTALTVARVSGGLAINAIPGEAIVELDLRSVSQEVIERIAGEIDLIVRAAHAEENERRARGTPPLAVAVESLGQRPAGETSAADPLVVAALEATRLIGREAEAGAASTDANVPIALGIPAIALGGGGRGGDAHTPGEWFQNVEGTLGLARALTIVCAAARIAHR